MTARQMWATARLHVDSSAELFVRTVQILAQFATQKFHEELARDGLRAASRVTLTADVFRWLDGSGDVDIEVTAAAMVAQC